MYEVRQFEKTTEIGGGWARRGLKPLMLSPVRTLSGPGPDPDRTPLP
ncbi:MULTISPECIES: hypothetical protein [unclassified Streptomyces]